MTTRLVSECKRYEIEAMPGLGPRFRLFDREGNFICESTFWANLSGREKGRDRVRFETGSGEVRAVFTFPRYPRWFYRRWVAIWKIEREGLIALIEKAGAEVLAYFKPPMNCFHHVGFKAAPHQRLAVDAALRRRKLEFRSRRLPGCFDIPCDRPRLRGGEEA